MGGKKGGLGEVAPGLQAAGRNYSNQVKKGEWGGLATDLYKGYLDTVLLGGQGDNLKKAAGLDKSKQKQKLKEAEALRAEETKAARTPLNEMLKYDQQYIDRIESLDKEAAAQAKDASKTYSNDIQPRLKEIMERAGQNARSAMSLEEAGDVNNKVHQSVRQLYDDQAQAVNQRALADAGVLQAMGAQATANVMGTGGPMTGSQLQLINANNMQASGRAVSAAQAEMERLRQQGIDRGFSESAAQYARGVDAENTYNNRVLGYESGMDRNILRQRDFRNESLGYGGMTHGLQSGGSLRELGYIDQIYGGKQEGINQAIAMANADNAAKAGMVSAGVGVGGTILGGILGGPVGAIAGSMAGQQAGQAVGQAGQAPVYAQRPGYNYQPSGTGQQAGYYGGAGRYGYT